MEYKYDFEGDVTVMKLTGELDAMTAPGFEQACDSLIAEGRLKLILDCRKLAYVSSAGLRGIHACVRRFKALGGQLVLSSLNEPVREVFAITGFFSIIPAYAGLEEAKASMLDV